MEARSFANWGMGKKARAEGEGEIIPPLATPWTLEEENKLRELILGGKSVEAIAELLNRTPLAVRHRASKLRLPLRRIEPRGQRSG
jgi:Myb-like DNA-binding domain